MNDKRTEDEANGGMEIRIRPMLCSLEGYGDAPGLPHRRFLDLTVCYGTVLSSPGKPPERIGLVMNGAHGLGWPNNDDGIHAEAMRELEKETPVITELRELLGVSLLPIDWNIRVLTNEGRFFGASLILREDVMEGAWDRLGGDFFVLPSSVHEVLLVPCDSGFEPQELKGMVSAVNRCGVIRPEEYLSDSVYVYRKGHGLEVAA